VVPPLLDVAVVFTVSGGGRGRAAGERDHRRSLPSDGGAPGSQLSVLEPCGSCGPGGVTGSPTDPPTG
jgi:hypothetical protein